MLQVREQSGNFATEILGGCGSSSVWGYVSEFQRFVRGTRESSAAGPSNRKSYHNKMAVLSGTLLSTLLANGIAELLCCASEMSSRRDLRSHPLCSAKLRRR